MSQQYRYQFEISPCNHGDTLPFLKTLQEAGYPVEPPEICDGGKEGLFWGETGLSAMSNLDDRHQYICSLFPGRKVVTRWKCVEYDEWDASFGDDDGDDDGDDPVAVDAAHG